MKSCKAKGNLIVNNVNKVIIEANYLLETTTIDTLEISPGKYHEEEVVSKYQITIKNLFTY